MYRMHKGYYVKEQMMSCMAKARPGSLGVPLAIVSYEDVPSRLRPLQPVRHAPGVAERRTKGEPGAPATPPKHAAGSGRHGAGGR